MDKRVIVLGGGISGLSAGFFLKQEGFDPVVIESAGHPGGCISSYEKDGFICESGPNTVLLNNEPFFRLLNNVGISNHLIFADNKASKKRYILKNNRPELVPKGPFSIFNSKLLSLKGAFRIFKEPFIKKTGQDKISVAEFMTHRFGREVYDHFINPFLAGIYAGKPTAMSMKYTFPLLYEVEQKYGSIIKGMIKHMRKTKKKKNNLPKQKMFTLSNGLSMMPQLIANNLGEKYLDSAHITSIQKEKNSYKVIFNKNGYDQTLSSSRLISTLPAFSLSKLLKNIDPATAAALDKVHYAPITILHLGFNKKDVEDSPTGFGLLVPETAQKKFIGILFNSDIFNHTVHDNKRLMTVFIGGDRNPELCSLSSKEIKQLIIPEIKDILKIKADPIFTNTIYRKQAIPQYGMSQGYLMNQIKIFENAHTGFHISGNFINGISVGDCVKSSYKLSRELQKEG